MNFFFLVIYLNGIANFIFFFILDIIKYIVFLLLIGGMDQVSRDDRIFSGVFSLLTVRN